MSIVKLSQKQEDGLRFHFVTRQFFLFINIISNFQTAYVMPGSDLRNLLCKKH